MTSDLTGEYPLFESEQCRCESLDTLRLEDPTSLETLPSACDFDADARGIEGWVQDAV